ncbi:MAG: urease accessory protein UreF [Sporichthyaceae bacterium]
MIPQIPMALLVLADARLPAGGHSHSGGAEAAVASGAVCDLATLAAFLRGRLHTQGLTQAALTAAACARALAPARAEAFADLDRHTDARHPAPVQRRVSRAQGRALLRAGRAAWPGPIVEDLAATAPDGPHQAVALGALAAAAGVAPGQAALAAAYTCLTGPATAVLRLLGLDPYGVHAVVAALASDCEGVARTAAAFAHVPFADLPAAGGPLLDITAIEHEQWEVRLFAS